MVVVYSPDIHKHHGTQPEDWVDHQLHDARPLLGRVGGLGDGEMLQHQVVGGVAVPLSHVAQNLQTHPQTLLLTF